MKQRIDIEQLDELSQDQKTKIREWWYGSPPRLSDLYVVLVKYDDVTRYEGPYVNSGHRNFLDDYNIGDAIPLLSIGQMIELLSGEKPEAMEMNYIDYSFEVWTASELCDRLWEKVKLELK